LGQLAAAAPTVDQVSRIAGIAFHTPAQLRAWEALQADAAARDHRALGRQHNLFWMHPYSPGSAFLLPDGVRIANRLRDLVRAEYRRAGYQEVETPLLFNKRLWETSGHWDHYRDDMFVVGDAAAGAHDGHRHQHSHGEEKDGEVMGLKPMNCPGHCLLFKNKRWSYRELPVRFAEFSPLHRNEASGALGGLTRVRKFHQDDAHIFCRPDQVQREIAATLAMIRRVYTALGFPSSYSLALSTRPASSVGSDDQWRRAEDALRAALDASGTPYAVRDGDGAFYGPKIDVLVTDAVGRSHQTATLQLDFQLPVRFGLQYDAPATTPTAESVAGAAAAADAADEPARRPVLIHRAALGSVERILGILIEHHAARWPFWMSPRQCVVLPATTDPAVLRYAAAVARALADPDAPWDADAAAADAEAAAAVPENEGGDGGGELAAAELAASPQGPTRRFHHVDARLADADASLARRVRDAWLTRYNCVVVVGARELRDRTLAVRWAAWSRPAIDELRRRQVKQKQRQQDGEPTTARVDGKGGEGEREAAAPEQVTCSVEDLRAVFDALERNCL
ncbi:54S ribosomal protein L39, mitochondrial, partial [Cladochytrium tenue]